MYQKMSYSGRLVAVLPMLCQTRISLATAGALVFLVSINSLLQ